MNLDLKRLSNFNMKIVSALLLIIVVAACSQNVQRDAVCELADRWNAASTAVADKIGRAHV